MTIHAISKGEQIKFSDGLDLYHTLPDFGERQYKITGLKGRFDVVAGAQDHGGVPALHDRPRASKSCIPMASICTTRRQISENASTNHGPRRVI